MVAGLSRKGLVFGFGAYLIWGFFPLYFKALSSVPAPQILAHRFVWSFLLLSLILRWRKEWKELVKLLRDAKVLALYAVAGGLLALNWGIFVWAVGAGYVVESSLGYFINPLVNVVLGVFLLREKLRWSQWLPIGIATVGVLYLSFQYRSFPWIALMLALTFGFYGLVKKIAPLSSLHGLTLETMVLFLPAFLYLSLQERMGYGRFGHESVEVNVLLMLTGVVTVIPLLMFGIAARLIPLWTMGLLQYIAPTCQFLLGVLVFHEPFSGEQLIGFSLIWLALLIFSTERWWFRRVAQLAH
ncbi:MAG: EamA family transporter RarD [Anaerolineales bacterium]|nr:EamA family transporter RarD [Anaerolineales bacterium]MCS7246915.1 EamA family transporter RarD [Anaerolineales bacterium]MDW8160726.1 EamA family transporter RarD [Anaerolineales bacterium]MDW8446289.1 EamA family transporter RarD [Anaerolineales bacterium]